MSKKSKVVRPARDPDHYSKRGVPYWWSPEWTRGTSSDSIRPTGVSYPGDIMNNQGEHVGPCDNYGKIHAVKTKNDVELHMKSKEGKLTYIQGSIQKEFKRWHEDRQVDYLLFGLDPDDILASDD